MGKARQIAVLIGTDRQYHRGVLQGLARYSRLHGPWELNLNPKSADGKTPLRKDSNIDGVVLLLSNRRQVSQVRRWNLPVVNLSSRFPEEDFAHVSNDGTSMAKLAIEHFVERGFRNFAFCDLNDGSVYRRRRFEEQLTARKLSCHVFKVDSLRRNEWILGRDRPKLESWLQQLPKPIGILAHNDIRGMQLVDACRRLNIAVPDEVAVLGVDNEMPNCEMCYPPLSSIATDSEGIGFEAGALLDQMMNGKRPDPLRVLIPPLGVVVRQSTDVTATSDPHVAKAVRYIREHATDGIDVSAVVRHVSISRTALDKRFLNALGHTPHEEIVRIRLKRASELLAETDLSLESIAGRCGFHHGEYLGAVFLRQFNQTPGEFRARCESAQGKSPGLSRGAGTNDPSAVNGSREIAGKLLERAMRFGH
jgi:LacI family transcriptional regulator